MLRFKSLNKQFKILKMRKDNLIKNKIQKFKSKKVINFIKA